MAGQEAVQENSQLRKMLELDRDPVIATSAFHPVTGRVIARSPTVWHSSVAIDLGSSDGVVVDDPVINGDGLVGEVSAVQRNSSQVNLITDHTSAVSAKVLPTEGRMTPWTSVGQRLRRDRAGVVGDQVHLRELCCTAETRRPGHRRTTGSSTRTRSLLPR